MHLLFCAKEKATLASNTHTSLVRLMTESELIVRILLVRVSFAEHLDRSIRSIVLAVGDLSLTYMCMVMRTF